MREEAERKMERWFLHLPMQHPMVKVLFKAAVDRIVVVDEVLPPDKARGSRR